MSFSDRPTLTAAQKLGCFAYGVLAFLVSSVGLIFFALGPWEPRPDGSGCEQAGLIDFLAFPGLFIIMTVGGLLLARYMISDED